MSKVLLDDFPPAAPMPSEDSPLLAAAGLLLVAAACAARGGVDGPRAHAAVSLTSIHTLDPTLGGSDSVFTRQLVPCNHPSRLRPCRPVCAVRGHLHGPCAGPAHRRRAAAHAGGFPAPARPHQLWAAARGAAAPAGRASHVARRGRPAAARHTGLARNLGPLVGGAGDLLSWWPDMGP